MKQTWKRLVSFLLCLVMVAALLPVQTRAEEMVYLIEDEEDFLAITDNPEASYKLMADLDLGNLERPVGSYYNEWWGGSWGIHAFSGSLDGNGHTIRYSMNALENATQYGLFGDLQNAEIFNLTLEVDLDLTLDGVPHDCYVSPFGRASNTAFGGVRVTGSISVEKHSDGGGNLYLAGLSYGDDTYYNETQAAMECDVDLDITAETTGDNSLVYYKGFFSGGSPVYSSRLSGGVELKCEGKIYVYQLINAQDSAAVQNLRVETESIDVYGIHGGSDNVLMADYDLNTKYWVNACGIYYSNGSSYYGNIHCSKADSASLCGARESDDVYVEATLYCPTGEVIGLMQCTNSTFTGSLDCPDGPAVGAQSGEKNQVLADVTGGESAIGLSDETRSYAEGALTSRGHSVGIYGGSYGGMHYYNTFVGTITATAEGLSGDYGTYAVGSQNDYSIVHADIRAQTGGKFADAYGVPDYSYFTGSVTGSNISGIGSNSYGSATLHGDDGNIAGQNSYFTGDVTFENSSGVTLSDYNSYVNATVTVRATDDYDYGNALYFSGLSSAGVFEGSATVYAGEVDRISVPGGVNAMIYTDNCGNWNSRNIRENGIWVHNFPEYSYRDCKHTQHIINAGPEDFKYASNGYSDHYQRRIGTSPYDAPTFDGIQNNWDGTFDADGNYTPDIEDASYDFQVVDMYDSPIADAMVLISGAQHITDGSGKVYVSNGPGVISLEVRMKNADGTYETVLTRKAMYPVPDQVNIIRLEPVLDADLTFLASEDSQEGTGTASGGSANLAGQNQPTLSFPVKVDIEGSLGKNISFATKWDPEKERLYIALGTGMDGMAEPDKFDMAEYKKAVEGLDSNDYDTWSEANRTLAKMQKESAGIAFGTWDTKVLGYAEWDYLKNEQRWELYDSGLILGAKGELRHVYPLTIPGAYGTLAIQGDLQTKARLEMEEDVSEQTVEMGVNGTFNPKVRAEGALGAGLRTARLYMEVGLGAEMDTKLHFPFDNLADNLTINAVIDAFGEVNCLIYSNRITIAQLESKLWPQNDIAVQTLNSALTSGDGFAIAPRAYANNAVMPLSEDGESATYLGLSSENSYPYAEVSLVELSGGKYLLVYTDDDLSRGAADRSALRCCIGTETDGQIVWGEPITIENDGTGDYGFHVSGFGNQVAIVWQDANRSFGSGEGISVAEMAASLELSQVVLDCSSGTPVPGEISTVAEAGSMPYFPTVYYYGYKKLQTAWVTTSNPDPSTYLADEKQTLWLSDSLGVKGTAVVENQTDITGVALMDGNLFWTTGTGETAKLWHRAADGTITELDSGNIHSLQSNNKKLCYLKDNQLYYVYPARPTASVPVASGEAFGGILRLSSDGEVYTAHLSTEKSRIYTVSNGKALPIAEFEGYLSAWDACSGHVAAVVRSGFEETDTASFTTQANEEIVSMEVSDVIVDHPEAGVGTTVTFCAEIANNGYNPINSLTATITAADGTVLNTQDLSCAIQPGDSKEVRFGFTVPEGFTAQEVTVSIGEEVQTVSLGGSNLKVYARWSQLKPDGVSVEVSNTGLNAASGTLTVTEGGTVLYSEAVSAAAGETETLWVSFGRVYDETTDITVTLTETDGAARSYDNEVTVTAGPVELVALRAGALHLKTGEAETLTVTAWPTGAKLPQLSYRSADESIATVDANGRVTAISAGETEITVTAPGGESCTAIVTVAEETQTDPEPTDPIDPEPTDPEPTDPTDPEPTDPEPTNPTEPEPTDPTEPSVPEKPENPFGDVQEGAYYYDAVQWAVEKGVTTGLTAKRFGPDENCTRGQIVTFLWRAAGEPEPKSSENPFTDVKPGDFYYTAVLWAVEQGITTGLSRNTFGPNESCNRGQVATFLYRYAGKPSHSGNNPFTDVAKGAFYYDAVLWALENQVTTGLTARTFGPEQTCTRGQIVTFLYRAIAK